MGNDIKTHLADPLEHFYYDIQISNKKSLEASTEIIDEIKNNQKKLDKIERAFTEKKSSLVKKNSIFKSEEKKYRGEMISTNEVWSAIQYRYTKLLEDFDITNESRCEFTKKQVVEFAKILNRLPQSDEVEDRLKKFAKIPYTQYEVEENIVLSIEQEFGRSQLLRPLKMFESVKMRYLGESELLMKLKEI